MVVRSALGRKLAVLVVAMLMALAGWPGYKGVLTAVGVADAQVPHFKCYVITPPPSLNEPIRLTDQFGEESVVVREPQFVCAPVEVKCRTAADGTETCETFILPLEPNHLKCHNITPSGPPINRTFVVEDQFGPETLTVRTAQLLCAPATKTPVTPTP